MVELSDRQIEAANARGRIVAASAPHAARAWYDAGAGRVVVELTSGATFSFPPALVQGLAGASPEALADVTLLGGGYGLHWEQLNIDFTVGGLVNGVFGTARWLAAQAGRASSDAKAAAARANGAKGGRPRNTASR